MKVIAALGILVLMLLVLPAVSQVPDDKLIVPGQRIGKWKLEMSIDELSGMNGPPSSVSQPVAIDSAIVKPSVHFWDPLGLAVATGGNDKRPVLLIALSDIYKTSQGIGVGATREAVEAVYGKAPMVTRWSPDATAFRLIYDRLGITVRLIRGAADSVYIFKPGTAKNLWTF